MKKIILQSKLSEDDALSKLGVVSKDLLEKGLISKGDELVAGVEEKDGKTLITINADLMTKDNYKNIKAKFLEVGKVLENDLKNFDEDSPENLKEEPKEPEEPEEPKKEEPKNEETHEKQQAVDQNSIKPAEAILHDTSELLFDINPNRKDMDDLKTLLFSEEEIKNAPESEEKRPAEPSAEEKKPEVKEHDTEGKEISEKKDPVPDEEPKKEDPKPEAPKAPERKEHDDQLKEEPKKEDPKPEEKKELELHDLLFSEEELKDPEKKEDPKKEDPKPEEPKKECPFHDREEALKALAEYRHKAAEGKTLSVAEKYFCDAASKHFSDEEVKEAEKSLAPKPEVKPEEPKKEEKKPEVKEHDVVKKFKVLCPEGKLIKDGFESEEAAKKFIEESKIEGATVAEMKEHDDQLKEEPKKEGPKPEAPKAPEVKPEEKKEDPKKEDPKPEAPKADPKPEVKPEEKKEETKMELIRRLNKKNSGNTLLGRAKDILNHNK